MRRLIDDLLAPGLLAVFIIAMALTLSACEGSGVIQGGAGQQCNACGQDGHRHHDSDYDHSDDEGDDSVDWNELTYEERCEERGGEWRDELPDDDPDRVYDGKACSNRDGGIYDLSDE